MSNLFEILSDFSRTPTGLVRHLATMRPFSRPPSRQRRAVLAAVALIAVVLCFLIDLRFRPTGVARLALWGGGLVVYGVLLSRAAGPVIDWRDRDHQSR